MERKYLKLGGRVMGTHKKIVVLFTLLALVLFIGFEAEAGRPIYLSDYVGQGDIGTSWTYKCQTDKYLLDIVVTRQPDDLDGYMVYTYRYLPDGTEQPFLKCKIAGGSITINQWPGCDFPYPIELSDRQPTGKAIDIIDTDGNVDPNYALTFDATRRGGGYSVDGLVFPEYLEVTVLDKSTGTGKGRQPYFPIYPTWVDCFIIPLAGSVLTVPPGEPAPECPFLTFPWPDPDPDAGDDYRFVNYSLVLPPPTVQ
jgi:hypothetical protein